MEKQCRRIGLIPGDGSGRDVGKAARIVPDAAGAIVLKIRRNAWPAVIPAAGKAGGRRRDSAAKGNVA
jgi:isocitrate/isopropylmalate dehydrogenase